MLKNTSKAYPIDFQTAGFAGLGGQINKDAFPNRFRRCTKDAVGQHQIFVHGYEQHVANQTAQTAGTNIPLQSQLGQWPCQIKLASVNAPYFDGAKLLIAADCTAYAYANIHQEFMRVKIHLNQAGIHFLH